MTRDTVVVDEAMRAAWETCRLLDHATSAEQRHQAQQRLQTVMDTYGHGEVARGTVFLVLITERTRLPLSIGISGANLHDSQALVPLVQGIPPIRSRRGRQRRRPGKPHGDKGYDYNHLRRWLRGRGITPRIARKGKDSSQRLGRHRWTIERTMAWLAGCWRLHRRYERKARHFLAFAGIACTLICYRRLTSTDDLQDASA
jgi:transposase